MHQRQCSGCKSLVTLAVAALLAMAPGSVGAAESACRTPPFRAFDFWLGHWQVELADGSRAGRNRISAEQGGCVLVERWEGAGGGTGLSMNFFDPHAGQWRQLWVSPGTQIDIAGGMVNGSMVLEGHIFYLREGNRYPFRGTWTLLPDGRVRQFFEEAREPGTWTSWFEGFYRRLPE